MPSLPYTPLPLGDTPETPSLPPAFDPETPLAEEVLVSPHTPFPCTPSKPPPLTPVPSQSIPSGATSVPDTSTAVTRVASVTVPAITGSPLLAVASEPVATS